MTDWKEKTLQHWERINNMASYRFGESSCAEEAALFVMDGLEANNWQRVQSFIGNGSFSSYIMALTSRLLEDFARKRFGRTRPPLWVKTLGGIWEKLFTALCLERLSTMDAIEVVSQRQFAAKKSEIEKENVHQEHTAGSTEGYLPPSMGASKNAMVAGNIAPPAPPSDKRAELDRWIAELKKHCAPDAQTLSSLHSIKLQGEDILENQSQGLSSEKRKLILPLLQLLAPVIDEQSAITQCQLIRSKLAEDEESK